MSKSVSPEQIEQGLQRLERVADLTDTRFRIPVIGVRVGLDAILGLIPVIGDGLGALISLYLFVEAVRLGAPWWLRGRMLVNIAFDFLIGLIPLVGDVADVAWRANTRNTRLLRNWMAKQHAPVGHQNYFDLTMTTLIATVLVIAACVWVLRILFVHTGLA